MVFRWFLFFVLFRGADALLRRLVRALVASPQSHFFFRGRKVARGGPLSSKKASVRRDSNVCKHQPWSEAACEKGRMRGAASRHVGAPGAAGPNLNSARQQQQPRARARPAESLATPASARRGGGLPGKGPTPAHASSTSTVGPPSPPDDGAHTALAAPTSLAGAVALFVSHPTPRLATAAIAALACARAALAASPDAGQPLCALDALAALLAAGGWVAAEPGLHAALHIPGWPGAAVHAAHHAAPYHHASIDPPGLVAAWIGAVAALTAVVVVFLSAPPGPALTGLVFYCAAGLAYEAVHFGAHCAFVPAWAWARALRTHHQRHHLHSEAHWLAFTAPGLDGLMGRAPGRPGDVPRGPMAQAARAARREERQRRRAERG
jgi:hypothetical protein